MILSLDEGDMTKTSSDALNLKVPIMNSIQIETLMEASFLYCSKVRPKDLTMKEIQNGSNERTEPNHR